MKKNNLLPGVAIGLLVILVIAAILSKDRLYEIIGNGMQQGNTAEEKFEAEKYIQNAFNYTVNKKDFTATLIEFKSTGCTICKQMEPILEEIKMWDGAKVNVQVIQVMNPDSQELMKYFGIVAVPTHVLLNKKGDEVFRKYGFVPEEELKNVIQLKINI